MANVKIKRYSGSAWVDINPKTTIGQVSNLSSQLANMQIDIDDKAPETHTHSWSEVTGKPTFATVATSGSYNDLTNKPTIPSIPSVMTTTEGHTGTATTQRTINAVNLKSIILNHSPAGARPASSIDDGVLGTTTPSATKFLAGDRAWKRIAFSVITDTPDTLSGYGITDAAPLSHASSTSNPHNVTAAQVSAMSTSHAANAITSTNISNWSSAYGWGNHASAGYIKAHPTITMGTNTTNTSSPGYAGSFAVIDSITKDSNGHVTKINTKTVTMPSAQSIPSIPSVMETTEGNTGTVTTQRTINAKNLKDIILHHSPAGARTPTAHEHMSIEVKVGQDSGSSKLSVFQDIDGSGYTTKTGLALFRQYGSSQPMLEISKPYGSSSSIDFITNEADAFNFNKPVKVNDINVSLAGHKHTWSEITSKPSFATVATSGSYNDLTNKPTIPAAQVAVNWNSTSGITAILNKPNLATVATSGSYNDLSNKPTIPSIPSVMETTEGNTGTATTQRTINAKNLKAIILNHSPAGARTPTTHGHTISEITSLQSTLDSKIGNSGVQQITGGHGSTVLKLFYDEIPSRRSTLGLWASEPGVTYHGAGIGYNVTTMPHGTSQADGVIDTDYAASWIRFDRSEVTAGQRLTDGTLRINTLLSPNGHLLEAGSRVYSPNNKPSWSDIQSKPSVIIEGDSRLTNARPASDVSSWAKKSSLALSDVPTISIAKGGTGATTALAARANLGLGNGATASNVIRQSNWDTTNKILTIEVV